MTEAVKEFKYEVAISFLAQDEPLALELNDLLSPTFSTFIYSKKQEALAGRDGDEAFREVFYREARAVLVLYRTGWGETPFTRIEETAIRDRAHERKWDFVLFVALEEHPKLPEWLSKRLLYYGLPRFGKKGIAGIVERLIQDQGGSPRKETTQQRASRASRELKFQTERRAFLYSDKGARSADAAFDTIGKEILRLAEQIRSENAQLPFNPYTKRTSMGRQCVVVIGPLRSLSIQWAPHASNTLEHAVVSVCIWEGPPDLFGAIFINERPQKRGEKRYEFDVDPSMSVNLRDKSKPERLLTKEEFVESSLNWLIEEVVKANRKN